MRLKDSEPDASGYFVRSGPDGPERGPLTIDKLQDLAEFGNITLDWLVRKSGEEIFLPFSDLPELMTEVFPQKKSFQLKQYQKAKDQEAELAPIDVRDLFQCAAGSAVEKALTESDARVGGAETPGISLLRPNPGDRKIAAENVATAPDGIDVKAILQASEAMAKARTGEGERRGRASFSTNRTFLVVRWILAICFALFGIYVLGASGSWRLAIPMFGMAILLVALDFVAWMCDGVEGWVVNAAGKPPDFSDAERWLRAGDWSAAAAAFLAVCRKHPKQIRGYFAGISAAFAARDEEMAAAFHSLARKNLAAHDLNLLNGALRRGNVPPVPPSC